MNVIRTVELFAGIGGFRLGLERANQTSKQEGFMVTSFVQCNGNSTNINNRSKNNVFRIVWANEWDKYAAQIYRKNFGKKELYEGDIRKIDANDIPDCDLIVGGFPCQPHSFAGSGTTLVTARKLSLHYLGIELKPEYVELAKARLAKIPARLDSFIQPMEVCVK